MIYFLALQVTYQNLEIGLFRDNQLLHSLKKDRALTSKYLTIFFEELLQKECVSLNDISFYAVNIGPTPITSLRVILATLNGLSFATHMPLVSVDGLIEFFNIYAKNTFTVVLFNAFSDDVFYIYKKEQGCKNIDQLLQELKDNAHAQTITFIGQGTSLFQKKIKEYLGHQAIIQEKPDYLTLQQLGISAYKHWQTNNTHHQLFPLYIKKREYTSNI